MFSYKSKESSPVEFNVIYLSNHKPKSTFSLLPDTLQAPSLCVCTCVRVCVRTPVEMVRK